MSTDRRALILRYLDEQIALCEKATPGPWEMPLGPYIKSDGDGDNFSGGDWNVYPPLGESGPVLIANSEENALAATASRTGYPLALAALRAEIINHETDDDCGLSPDDDEHRPCPTISRIFTSLGLQEDGQEEKP